MQRPFVRSVARGKSGYLPSFLVVTVASSVDGSEKLWHVDWETSDVLSFQLDVRENADGESLVTGEYRALRMATRG